MLPPQHDPSMLDNGNVLIFDNGTRRRDDAFAFSRVIDVDPSTSEIVWEYRDQPMLNFHSNIISGARRLPNGNTLITEGFFGRMFQVTPEGEVVWKYINPHIDTNPFFGEVNGISERGITWKGIFLDCDLLGHMEFCSLCTRSTGPQFRLGIP